VGSAISFLDSGFAVGSGTSFLISTLTSTLLSTAPKLNSGLEAIGAVTYAAVSTAGAGDTAAGTTTGAGGATAGATDSFSLTTSFSFDAVTLGTTAVSATCLVVSLTKSFNSAVD